MFLRVERMITCKRIQIRGKFFGLVECGEKDRKINLLTEDRVLMEVTAFNQIKAETSCYLALLLDVLLPKIFELLNMLLNFGCPWRF